MQNMEPKPPFSGIAEAAEALASLGRLGQRNRPKVDDCVDEITYEVPETKLAEQIGKWTGVGLVVVLALCLAAAAVFGLIALGRWVL